MTSSKQDICIAVDCMGGDYAPHEIVKGAIVGARHHGVSLKLVGQPDRIQAELADLDTQDVDYEVVPATEVIEMGEATMAALRKKKDASIVVACKCVGAGEAHGMVSAGSTGAAMASSIFKIGRLKGIDRPAIAVVLPTKGRIPSILIDSGANADCIPEMLVQFGKMGSIFSSEVFKVNNPRVGLLNIGEEASKGNSFYLSAFKLLEQSQEINFIGNIEGRHLFDESAEVVVCDGFTGNVAIKIAEGFGNLISTFLKEELNQNIIIKTGALIARSAFKSVKRKVTDEDFGGALLLGVKGICVIAHGGSNSYAIENAIRVAKGAIEGNVVSKIENRVLMEGCV